MKIIDKYVIKSFLITFASVFVILFFIFILYALWMFIPDLAGKGLSVWMVLKFLSYVMPTLVPLILPLSILLASIMTFGSFAENYEFAAMKSAGMSLARISKGLMFFILFLSGIAFFFANDVIPYSKYKAKNFRNNLRDKPSMAIAEGQFNNLGLYNIKVDKKSGDNDELLEGVVIHKKSATGKNTTVTKAKRGELVSKEDSSILQLVLYDGHHYEEITPKKHEEKQRQPFAKADFQKYVINMDLSGLINVDLDSDSGESTDGLLNVSELRYAIDSLKTDVKKDQISFIDNIHYRTTSVIQTKANTTEKSEQFKDVPVFQDKDILSIVHVRQRPQVLEAAYNNLVGYKYNVSESKGNMEFKERNIRSYQYSLYEKFVLTYSCLLMFFIGAPLGAIIRKGGFGLPIVFAIIVFIAYHFTTTFGRKIAQDGTIDAFMGAWGSSIILTPLAIMLTYRATNDKGMSMDWLTEPIKNFFRKIFKSKQKNTTQNA